MNKDVRFITATDISANEKELNMSTKKWFRRSLSVVVAAVLLLSTAVPALAAPENTQALPDSIGSHESLLAEIQTDFGGGKDIYVTGFTEDSAGNYYVMGTAAGQIGDGTLENDPNSSVSRVFLAKFSPDLVQQDLQVVLLSKKEDIGHDGYAFASSDSTYELYNSAGANGPLTVDDEGNVYTVVRNKAAKSLKYDISELAWEFDECYDAGCFWCDEEECDIDETCPVCTAYREFTATFEEGTSVDLVLVKFGADFAETDRYVIASDSGSKSNDRYFRPYDIALDSDGSIYISGSTGVDFISDPAYEYKAMDRNLSSPSRELEQARGFVVKINDEMDCILGGTYFGGVSAFNSALSGNSVISSIAVDKSGLYIAGHESGGRLQEVASEGFSDAAFPVSSEDSGGSTSPDGFIARLDKATFQVDAATYIGGRGSDSISALVISDSRVYVAGSTSAKDFPTHEKAYRRQLNASGFSSYSDGFVAQFNMDLGESGYAATYIGGESREDIFGMTVDGTGNVYITGETYGASTYPVTDGSSTGRAFVSKLNSDLSGNLISTILHRSNTDSGTQGRFVKVKDDGSILIVGQEKSKSAFIETYSGTLGHSRVDTVRGNPSFNSSPQYKGVDAEIEILITFDSFVDVDTTNGNPTLVLNAVNSEGENVEAVYTSGSGTKVLTFVYTVQNGDSTNGLPLNCLDEDALLLNGSTILPKIGGTVEDVNLKVPTDQYNLPYAKLYVNTVPASVKSVTSPASDAYYSIGAVIPIVVEFTDVIKTVDTTEGTPSLTLNSGGTATFHSITAANKRQLRFEYTVGSGDDADDLNYLAVDSLQLNGAVIQDNYGMDVNIALPDPSGESSLGANKDIVVKTDIPYIVSITTNKEKGYYKEGEVIPILVKFSQSINKTGTVKLAVNATDSYRYLTNDEEITGSDTDIIVFNYTVIGGHNAAPLDFSGSSLIREPDATITDSAGGPVSVILPSNEQEGGLGSQGIVVDTTPPKVNSINKEYSGASGTYFKAGDKIILKATISEEVIIEEGAAPFIEINYQGTGDANKRMVFEKQDKEKKQLYFSYTIEEGDSLINGEITMPAAEWKITADPEEITDAAGNDLNGVLPPPTWYSNPWKGLYFDTEGPTFGIGAKLIAVYNETDNKVDLSWDAKPTDAGSGLDKVYLMRKEVGSESDPVEIKSFSVSDSDTSYSDVSITQGKTYIYSVYGSDKAKNAGQILYSQEISVPKGQAETDVEPPYWVQDAELDFERISSVSVILSWNPAKATDDFADIKGFKIYHKAGTGAEDWALLDTVMDSAASEYVVSDIDAGAHTFKVTVIDQVDLESKNAIIVEVPLLYPLLEIVDSSHGTVIKAIYAEDLTEVEIENQHFSGTSIRDGVFFNHWYGVTGLYIEDILESAGIKDDYLSVRFQSIDNSGYSLSKELIQRDQYYFGLNDQDRQTIKPMIALWYTDYELGVNGLLEYRLPEFYSGDGSLPANCIVEGGPRLFFGQTAYLQENRSYFVKDVYRLIVNIDENLRDQTPPTLIGVEEGSASIAVGESIPAGFPETAALSAVDAYGLEIENAAITRTITALANKEFNSHDINDCAQVADVYTITYQVTDARGNITTVVKTLVVTPSSLSDYGVAIEESEAYTIAANAQVPQIIVKDGVDNVVLNFEVIAGSNPYPDGVTATIVHISGNKMLSIVTVDGESFEEGTKVSASFEGTEGGDRIFIFVVDQLTAETGSPSNILLANNSESPEAGAQGTVVIEGIALPEAWVSVKVIDKNGEIAYFFGQMTGDDAEYSFTPTIDNSLFPLNVTITYGDSITETQVISDDSSGDGTGRGGSGGGITVPTDPTDPVPGPVWTNPFSDIRSGDWYYDAVMFVSEKGLFKGMKEDAFGPDTGLTRGMLVTVLLRLSGESAEGYQNSFFDVASGTWYENAVAWAATEGIVSGIGEGRFAPNEGLTREQLAVMLYNYGRYRDLDIADKGNALDDFTDAEDVSDWANEAVRWVVANGILSGRTDGSLDPGGLITRAEVASMLMRFIENMSIVE